MTSPKRLCMMDDVPVQMKKAKLDDGKTVSYKDWQSDDSTSVGSPASSTSSPLLACAVCPASVPEMASAEPKTEASEDNAVTSFEANLRECLLKIPDPTKQQRKLDKVMNLKTDGIKHMMLNPERLSQVFSRVSKDFGTQRG